MNDVLLIVMCAMNWTEMGNVCQYLISKCIFYCDIISSTQLKMLFDMSGSLLQLKTQTMLKKTLTLKYKKSSQRYLPHVPKKETSFYGANNTTSLALSNQCSITTNRQNGTLSIVIGMMQ